ncbi:MAG TPA: hypothetical protein VK506_09455, partial [Conexibacter sp.]|nr:hypothetical protein [Conexibacter sp.]
MSGTAAGRAGARKAAGARSRAPGRARDASEATADTTLSPRDAAWLAALPCALLTLLLVLALGPVVGDLLPDGAATFWESRQALLHPEPAEQGRFLVALVGPLLLAGATVLLARRPLPLAPTAVTPLVWVAQAALVVFALGCVVAQWGIEYGALYEFQEPTRQHYFDATTLVLSMLGAAAIATAARSARVREAAAEWTRDTPLRAVAWTLVAAGLIAVWLLHAFNTEGTIANAHFAAAYHL